ncbi:hypothetical protein [Halobacillus sp. Nhm2S1]|uniref:hypothetical protein n=1 Tax=Halobacillus sp. Nhm2S1 TaxID=2866716 RepID=UPI001C73829F|nr:hypothetical protein [Halobacillus sp. Nhm2S1]MBX0358451.1 hypothetical protein [Halobacillus sp. Nhm2S1]
MGNVAWIISLIFFILILVSTIEVLSISKRQRKLEEKVDEMNKNLNDLMKNL